MGVDQPAAAPVARSRSRGGEPAAAAPARVPPLVVGGFAVACIGGPVALVYQVLPGVIGDAALPSAGLVTAAAALLFALPVAVWWRFSGRISSAGGLYAFVEAAAGRRAARVHGGVWIVSYFLYLPSTATFVVYELLPPLAPGLTPYRGAIQLLLPAALAAAVLASPRASLSAAALLGAAQLALLLVLGRLEIEHVGFPASSFSLHANAGAVAGGAAAGSLLFLCASLPLYLGGAVADGGRTLRRGVAAGSLLVAVCAVAAAAPLAAIPAGARGGALPALSLARTYGGHALAVTAGAATILGILALVFAELLALTRLLTAMTGVTARTGTLGIGALFLAGDALALLGPDRAYESTLRPALGALYLSQLIVFAVYPRFERSRRLLVATPVAALAAAPLVYGLYLVLANRIAS